MTASRSTGIATPVASAVVAFALARGSGAIAGALLLALLIAVLLILPENLLQGIALGSVLLLPTEALPLPAPVQGMPVGVVPFAIWLLRAKHHWRVPGILYGIAVALTAWLLLAAAFAPLHTLGGAVWLAVAISTVCAVVLLRRASDDPQWLEQMFLGLTTALGCYAIIEAFLLHGNPLLDPLYASAQPPLVQHWSEYRATTTLGHPLVNGTVFAGALVLAVNRFLRRHVAVARSLFQILILAGAIIATHSRGAVFAAAIGVVLLLCSRWGASTSGLRRFVAAGLLIIGIVGFAGALAARSRSDEGRASTAIRRSLVATTKQAMRGTTVLGAGPGQAEAYRQRSLLTNAALPLESSYAQLAVAVGAVGLALFLALLAATVAYGLRSEHSAGPACALFAFIVAMGGYNAIEGHRQLLVLLGFMIAWVGAGAARSSITEPLNGLQGRGPRPRGESTPRSRVPAFAPTAGVHANVSPDLATTSK